jgi:hypothetical protein
MADLTVKILGITAFRYRHHAIEHWKGDCLTAMDSTTDDDGKPFEIHAHRQGDDFVITGVAEPQSPATGCVLTFAYWNPAVQKQTRLLNAQSGKLEDVEIKSIGANSIQVHGQPVDVKGFRITGTKNPIEIWYDADGGWVGLDSVVTGGRKLSYRLQ